MEPEQPAKRTPRIVPNRQQLDNSSANSTVDEPDSPQPDPADRPPAVGYHAGAEGQNGGANDAEFLPAEGDPRTWERPQLRGSHPGDRYVRVIHHAPATRPGARRAPVCGPALPKRNMGPFARWLLQGQAREMDAPYEREAQVHQTEKPWWQVMCLTGLDYFSTLGYQPGIAALAAGALAPIATLVLVLITLAGALPMYRRVAAESPHGDGSISMLERLLPWWQGKLFVLALLGFVMTGFVITITLSAADASAHLIENPYLSFLHGLEVPLTLALIALLGGVFLKGFSEAISIAVGLVAVYLSLNLVVIVNSFLILVQQPQYLNNWRVILTHAYSSPLLMIGASLLLFPKLALGLSGFETGVLVMPLVKGDPGDTEDAPAGRIRNARKLLTAAAMIMSVLLCTSSIVTIMLIPPDAFLPGGPANGRALAYVAHEQLGNGFGTVYDLSTILILWFAGASAMAGLLNVVPRYLPRYGMAPDWARAMRPLVLLFTAIAFAVTIIFKASVDAQAAAYATGVLALITSATIAVALSAIRRRQLVASIGFGLVAAIFVYTSAVVLLGQPVGLKIAGVFIAAIILFSLISRVWRTTELRVTEITVDETARRFIARAAHDQEIHIIANHPDERNAREYLLKDREQREDNNIPHGATVLFLEVAVRDASDFAPVLHIRGEEIGGYQVLRAEGASVPNAIAAFLLWLRDTTGKRPHVYFGWTEGNPFKFLARYILFGEGDIAPLTHEVLRKAERDRTRRPAVHVG